jgi:1-acyl-sn-glycerol-3-phosphate acyltransferase
MQRPLAVAFSYAEFLACALGFMPLLALARWRAAGDPTNRLPGHWFRNFGKATSALNPLWHFSVEGEPPADIGSRPYVVVSNHESNADPFLLSWLPWDMRWIAKQELFQLPLIGPLMRLGGDIALRRGDAESVRETMAECRRTLDHGLSVMFFPEGTRSRDGLLQPFKDGAFLLAIESRVPVLPIAIAGTRACLPKGSSTLGEARAIARVLTPIETQHMTAGDLDALREQTRTQMARAIGELRVKLGDDTPVVDER